MKIELFTLPSEIGTHQVKLHAEITPLVPVHKNDDGETVLPVLSRNDAELSFTCHVVEGGADLPIGGQCLYIGQVDGRYYFLEQRKVQISMPGTH